MKILLLIAWTLWTALLAWLSYTTYVISTERTHSPEATRGLGVALMFFLFLVVGAVGFALRWAGQRQSEVGVVIILILLCLPAIVTVSGVLIRAGSDRKLDFDLAKAGDFVDPHTKPMAAAIIAGDAAALKVLLATSPDTNKRDRADHSLLDFAIRRFRFEKGNPECIRLLLAAGANPNTPSANGGFPPLLDMGDFPDIVRVLVEAGADLETLADGVPAVVRFTSLRQWESAIYLVGKGARLDTSTPEGLSIDYYLKQWKDGVEGVPDEGWDRLRAAIAKRRK